MKTTLISFVVGLSLMLSGHAGFSQTTKPKPKPAPPVVKPAMPAPKPTPTPQLPAGPLTMMPPKAHTTMDRAAVSSDGRWVATSGGGKVRVWESETGRTTREFACSGQLHWMKDSRRLLVGGLATKSVRDELGRLDDEIYGTLQLWDVVSGKLLKEWQIPSVILNANLYVSEVTSLDVTDDEARALITTRGVGQAFVCDLVTGAIPVKLTERTGVETGHFLPGDREFAIYYVLHGYEQKIRETDRYETMTGKKVGTLPLRTPIQAHSASGYVFVNAAHTEPLGVKVSSEKNAAGVLVEEATGKVLRTVESDFAGFSPDGKSYALLQGSRFVRVDLLTGKATLSQPAPARGIVVEAIGSSAADTVSSANSSGYSAPAKDELTAVAFRADGKQLVSVTVDGRAMLWSGETLTPQIAMRGWNNTPNSILLAPDGKSALVSTMLGGTYTQLGNLRIIDPRTGQTLFWAAYPAELQEAVYSPNSKLIYVLGLNRSTDRMELRRLSLEDNTLSEPLFTKPREYSEGNIALSPDGTTLYCMGGLLDASSGRERANLSTAKLIRVTFNKQNELVGIARDGARIEGIATYAIQTGARLSLTPFKDHYWKQGTPDYSRPFGSAYRSGGTELMLGVQLETKRNAVLFCDVSTGSITRGWEFPNGMDVGKLITTSDPSRILVYEHKDWQWSLWDVNTGQKLQTLSKLDGAGGRRIQYLQPELLPDGKHLLTVQADENEDSLAVRSLEGKTRLSFLMLENGDWLAHTPEGAFDGSQGAIEKVYFSNGTRTYSLDQFAERFYRPGLVQLVLEGKEGVSPLSPEAALAQGAPPQLQFAAPPTSTTSAAELTVTLKATEQNGGGVRALRLYHNGRLVGGDSSLTGAGTILPERSGTFTIALEPGENRLRAVAYSRTNLESRPIEARIMSTAPAAAKPVLRVLSVGINKYEDASMNLEYARPDAEAFGQFFENQKTLFAGVKVTSLLDEKATRQGIEAALKALATESKPNDIVVIYLAGHGETAAAKPTEDEVENATQGFYFLPTEMRLMRDKNNVRKYGISGDQLDALIAKIGARRILIVYDACKSGAALGGVTSSGAQEQRQLALLARAQGLYILTASTSQQYASEVKALGHGILTYAMLEGLRGKAAPTESQIKVLSLLAYAEQRVPALAKELRNRDQRPVRYGRGVNFPLANK